MIVMLANNILLKRKEATSHTGGMYMGKTQEYKAIQVGPDVENIKVGDIVHALPGTIVTATISGQEYNVTNEPNVICVERPDGK